MQAGAAELETLPGVLQKVEQNNRVKEGGKAGVQGIKYSEWREEGSGVNLVIIHWDLVD